MTESSESEFSKHQYDNDTEDQSVKNGYNNDGNPERSKTSVFSSDEDTTSSTILPMPETLRQMRGDLIKKIKDGRESVVSAWVGVRVCVLPSGIVKSNVLEFFNFKILGSGIICLLFSGPQRTIHVHFRRI